MCNDNFTMRLCNSLAHATCAEHNAASKLAAILPRAIARLTCTSCHGTLQVDPESPVVVSSCRPLLDVPASWDDSCPLRKLHGPIAGANWNIDLSEDHGPFNDDRCLTPYSLARVRMSKKSTMMPSHKRKLGCKTRV